MTLNGTPPDLYTDTIETADQTFPQIEQISDQIKDIYRQNRDNLYSVTFQSDISSLVNVVQDLKKQRAAYVSSLLESALSGIQENATQKIESIPDTTVISNDLIINSLCVNTFPDKISEIRALPEVLDIFIDSEVAPLTETTAQTMKLRPNAYPQTVWNLGYHGEGISVMAMDTGVYSSHEAFVGLDLVNGIFPVNTSGCTPEDDGDHGTHTCGVIASQDETNRGMAFGIDTYYNAKMCAGQNGFEAMMEAYDWAALGGAGFNDASVMNFSMVFIYECEDRTGLDQISQWVDNTVDLYDVIWSLGAGNRDAGCDDDQLNDKPAVCWNGVAVAGIDDHDTGLRDDDTYYENSKYGPAYGTDGAEERLKPDILAPTNANSPANGGGWGGFGGTSGSAPHFSGYSAAMMSAGVTSSLELRALAFATAGDYAASPASVGPDYYAGFGEPDAWAAYEHIGDTFSGTFHSSGDNSAFQISNVQDGDRVVLVHNIHKSGTSYKLSNLDLKIYDKSNGAVLYQTTNTYENKEYIQFGPQDAGKDVVVAVIATQIPSGLTSEKWAVSANTVMTEYVEDDLKAPEMLSPAPDHQYILGENLHFNYAPAPGTSPTAYFINLWVDGEHFNMIPQNGINLGTITDFYIPFKFMELRVPDGLWEWAAGAKVNSTIYWSDKSCFLKYTAPTLIVPAHNTAMSPNDIFDWTDSEGALNYVMKIYGLLPADTPLYLPLNYTTSQFILTQGIYDYLDSGTDYRWAMAATALGSTLDISDQQTLSMLSYSVPWTFRKID
ncbi:MAG: S8/S53 family peptidase [bacterium]|nr:S8/S53 family peptidase [bacterium]